MSIKLMTEIFEMPVPLARKMLLLALADFAADDGSSIFPAVATMARKTSMKKRNVQNLLSDFRAGGILETVRAATFDTPAAYRLNLDPLRKGGVHVVHPALPVGGAPDAPRGVHVVQGGGARSAPDPSVDPSEDPSEERDARAREATTGRKTPRTAWPDGFGLTEARAAVATRRGCLAPALAWEAFASDAETHGRRYASWEAAWRTWCLNHDRYGCPCQPARTSRGTSPGFRRAPTSDTTRPTAAVGTTGELLRDAPEDPLAAAVARQAREIERKYGDRPATKL